MRLAWLGIATGNDAAMISFLRDTLGLRVEFDEPATVELSMPNDDRLQIFGPGHPYFAFFQKHSSGPVPLFEVDDAIQAAAELRAAGVDVVGNPDSDDTWTWIHVRAPDGNLYEFASRTQPDRDQGDDEDCDEDLAKDRDDDLAIDRDDDLARDRD